MKGNSPQGGKGQASPPSWSALAMCPTEFCCNATERESNNFLGMIRCRHLCSKKQTEMGDHISQTLAESGMVGTCAQLRTPTTCVFVQVLGVRVFIHRPFVYLSKLSMCAFAHTDYFAQSLRCAQMRTKPPNHQTTSTNAQMVGVRIRARGSSFHKFPSHELSIQQTHLGPLKVAVF